MNDANTTQFSELVWRRLSDPLRLFGYDLPPQVWLVILALVLLTAFFYVGWMYVKDSRGVGPWWALFLGLLRSTVYGILAVVFLLPAVQTFEETRSQSKVVLLFDTSGSMALTKDDVPTYEGEKLLTRQEKVLHFLADKKFIPSLEQKSPVTAYRLGTRLDENFLYFADGKALTRDEFDQQKKTQDELGRPVPAPEAKPLPEEYWASWLAPTAKPTAAAKDEGKEPDKRMEGLARLNEALEKAGLFRGTNVGDSVLAAVNRELNSKVQGIVIFTDGRSTEGSPERYEEVARRAQAANIPIFVVAVGEVRPQIRIETPDLRVPEQVQPEDRFRAVVDVTGEGMADQPAKIELDVTHVKKGKDNKEEQLPITLIEQEDKDNPGAKRTEIVLGKKITLKPPQPVKFDRGTPPRVSVEFQIDAATLADAVGRLKELTEGDNAKKKWVLSETKEGELRFLARLPKDKRESFDKAVHVSDPGDLRVLKRPLRVLLFASAPSRDYQFLRTLLVREMEKKRVDLSIFIQAPPGKEHKTGVVQDVPPDRLLGGFPNRLGGKGDDMLYDLANYDVIVAFDPDWTQLTAKQIGMVDSWVRKGGGLIAEGGPINTKLLARPPSVYADRLKPILGLYPVVLEDIRLDEADRSTSDPWPLLFDQIGDDMEFLRLGEEEGKPFQAEWDAFFYGDKAKEPGKVAEHGFFSCYPVKSIKSGGTMVVARFGDPLAKLKTSDGRNQQQPYIVTMPVDKGRTVWLASGETWRLREHSEAYHERFWTKLLRYTGHNSQTKMHQRLRLEMRKQYTANRPIEFEVQAEGDNGEPLGADAKVEVKLTPPAGAAEGELKTTVPMKAKPGGRGWFVARFQLRDPGDYGVEIRAPKNDSLVTKFNVKEANPEMDNTRPDFERLYRMASDADPVLKRLGDAERAELKKQLQRPKVTADPAAAKPSEETAGKDDRPRLYFDLKTAHLIPTCMTRQENVQRNRGPISDYWDDGWTLWASQDGKKPVKLSWVLTAVVGLLCLEWLTRKLLRLA